MESMPMAYIQPGETQAQLLLEGRPLVAGDALWIPADPTPDHIIRGWVGAAFVRIDEAGRALVTLAENGALVSLPRDVGLRRRETRAADAPCPAV
jgi:hypothetical protein